MSFNLAVLTGRITADTELKTTPNGVSVCTFSIAVDRGYGDNKQTDYINIVAWRQTAEFVAKYCKKGSLIGIEGSIQTRKYTDKNGYKRTLTEVVAKKVEFMESKKSEPNNEAGTFTGVEDNGDFTQVEYDGDLPF